MTPYELLRNAVAGNAARPLVTFYDDATGERVELSVATFDNWVAKTANLLQDGLAVEPGEVAAVALPVHWQALVVATACWAAGVVVRPLAGGAPVDGPVDGPVDVAFVGPDRLAAGTRPAAREIVALSLLPLGRPLDPAVAADRAGVFDYALEVPAYGDRFAAYAPPTATDPAVEAAGGRLTHAGVLASADALANAEGWSPGVRLMVTRDALDLPTLLATAVVPMLLDGSVVICRHADPDAIAGRRAAERVTAGFD